MSNVRSTLSVVVVTKNEEELVRNCLASVKQLADEIVVVDDYSSDKTIKIAKEFTDKIFLRRSETLGKQKNWAISQAKSDWVLLLDADEKISPELRAEILTVIQNDNYDGYNIYFQQFLFGKPLLPTLSGGHPRLFRRGKGKITDLPVHEKIVVNGKIGQLKNPIIHFSYPSVFAVVEKFNRYTNPEALLAYQRGERTNLFKIITVIPRVFFWRFLLGGEWKDGRRGFIVSALFGIYHLLWQLKLWEIQNSKGKDKFDSVRYIPKA